MAARCRVATTGSTAHSPTVPAPGYRGAALRALAAAADVVASVRDQIASGALDDDDRAEALEQSADDDYGEFIPTDSVIEAAFRAELERQPTAFAKL
jgi:hypothetical protein